MRKCLLIFAVIVPLVLALTGCGRKAPVQPETAETALPVSESNAYTKVDILDMFMGYAYAAPSNRIVIDYVVVPESEYGIVGVVQYTTEDYKGCWFDFLTESAPRTVGLEAAVAEVKRWNLLEIKQSAVI